METALGFVLVLSILHTGHTNAFTSLQNAVGFMGFENFSFYGAGDILGLNLLAALR